MGARITISLVEDDAETRKLWWRWLALQADFVLLDGFADAESALAQLPARLPAVLLVDWHLPGTNGIELIRQLKAAQPRLRCLLITAYDLDHLPAEAVRSGADGFIYKSDPLSELPDRIRAAHAGKHPLSDRAVHYLFQSLRNEPAAGAVLEGLTKRELEVLLRVSTGLTEKEVAAELGRSVNTIHNQLTSAYRNLGVHNRAEALTVLRGGGSR